MNGVSAYIAFLGFVAVLAGGLAVAGTGAQDLEVVAYGSAVSSPCEVAAEDPRPGLESGATAE